MNILSRAAIALALAGAITPALARPRESILFASVLSNPAPAGGGNAPFVTHTFTGGYPVRYIEVDASLLEIATGTFAREAVIQVIAPGGITFTLQPSQVVGYTTSTDVTNYFYKLPIEVPDAAGSWTFSFTEIYNDSGATDDQRWAPITFTLNDGAPEAKDLGVLTQQGRTRVFNRPVAAGAVQWYKFLVPSPITVAAGTYLDIDTNGSSTTNTGTGVNDTEVALYNSDGVLIAADDDAGAANESLLSFGLGGRPAEGNSASYNGQNGEIPAGVYYLAVSAYNTFVGPIGWDVNSSATATGTLAVRMRTNVGIPNATSVGTLSQGTTSRIDIPIAPGGVQWFKFDVAADAFDGSGAYVDIHTLGSVLPGSFSNNDTVVAIYDVSGNRVGIDDDGAGIGNITLLSFGQAGRGPFAPGGANANGQDGPLPAGAYYAAITAFGTNNYGTDYWGVSATHVRTGLARLHFVTNTGGPGACPADLSNSNGDDLPDGGVTVDDLLYFLLHFEQGC